MLHPEPIEKEIPFEGGIMITETDLGGRITYVNRKFIQMSAYEKGELLGKSHSIMRHPDMPKCCFEHMWETLKKGQTWKGYVKNLRKDGAYYWVIVYVSPKYDDSGKHIGYIAARKVPDRHTLSQMIETYKELTEFETLNAGKSINFIGNSIGEDLTEVS